MQVCVQDGTHVVNLQGTVEHAPVHKVLLSFKRHLNYIEDKIHFRIACVEFWHHKQENN